jgi:hypothetical protein
MTDRGNPTPDAIANRPKRRTLTLVGGLVFAAGTLAAGGGFIDSMKAWSDQGWSWGGSSSYQLVHKYEDAAIDLGRTGKESQLVEQFNPQQVEDAYKQLDAENNRRNLDTLLAVPGGMSAVIGAAVVILNRRKR